MSSNITSASLYQNPDHKIHVHLVWHNRFTEASHVAVRINTLLPSQQIIAPIRVESAIKVAFSVNIELPFIMRYSVNRDIPEDQNPIEHSSLVLTIDELASMKLSVVMKKDPHKKSEVATTSLAKILPLLRSDDHLYLNVCSKKREFVLNCYSSPGWNARSYTILLGYI